MTMTDTVRANVPLIAARILAGLIGLLTGAGYVYFSYIHRDTATDGATGWEALIDNLAIEAKPFLVVAMLVLALAPRLRTEHRILIGLVAAPVDVAFSLVKLVIYDETEALVFGVASLALFVLLVSARSRPR